MSISVTGFKGKKNLFETPIKEKFKKLLIDTAENMFLKVIASNIDALLTHYAYNQNIDEVMQMVGPLNSIEHLMSEFKEYPQINDELNIYYEDMRSNLNEKTCFNFFINYIRLSNKLNSENPNQYLTYVSSNIVDVSVIEYPFKNYSIYQFFYGSLDLGSLMDKKMNKIKELKDYYYYDNTDKPRNSSERIWNKRRKDWINIIKRCGSYFSWRPKDGGENYFIANINDIKIDFEKISPYRNNLEQNVKILAKKIMIKDYYKVELEKAMKENGYSSMKELNESQDYSIYSHAFFDTSKFVKEQIILESDIYLEYLDKIKEKII